MWNIAWRAFYSSQNSVPYRGIGHSELANKKSEPLRIAYKNPEHTAEFPIAVSRAMTSCRNDFSDDWKTSSGHLQTPNISTQHSTPKCCLSDFAVCCCVDFALCLPLRCCSCFYFCCCLILSELLSYAIVGSHLIPARHRGVLY